MIAKTMQNNEMSSEGIIIADLKLYYREIVEKNQLNGVHTETGM